MIYRAGSAYAKIFGRPWAVRWNRGLMQVAGRALGFLNYQDEASSGERGLLQQLLAGRHDAVVFDVGAHSGSWTRAVLETLPTATVHAFEASAPLASALAEALPGVRVHAMAVTAASGTVDFYDYAELPAGSSGSEHASAVAGVIERVHNSPARRTVVPAVSIDDYCQAEGITHIDLLKIDVEGQEYEVLVGANRLLAGGVAAVQFEFNEMSIVARRFVEDFQHLLGGGFILYRLLPRGALMPLDHEQPWLREQFVFQNLVALRREHPLARRR